MIQGAAPWHLWGNFLQRIHWACSVGCSSGCTHVGKLFRLPFLTGQSFEWKWCLSTPKCKRHVKKTSLVQGWGVVSAACCHQASPLRGECLEKHRGSRVLFRWFAPHWGASQRQARPTMASHAYPPKGRYLGRHPRMAGCWLATSGGTSTIIRGASQLSVHGYVPYDWTPGPIAAGQKNWNQQEIGDF